MHTESNAVFVTNVQQKSNHLQQPIQQQQNHVNHLSQENSLAEQQQIFIQSPSTSMEVATSLNEGLYAPTTQQQLTSECLSQYYNCATTHGYPTMSSSSSSSSSSCSGSSSDENNYSCPIQSPNNGKNTTSIGVNLRVTGQCSQGGRKYMEDYFSVAYQQSDNAKDLEYAFIGIYDGHGGAEAAKFAKEHLMMEIINQRLFWSENDHDVLRAIREGYIATHYSMWREQDKWPKTANGLPSTAGTTATVAFIRREKIYIGHVGDSGIVLGYQNDNENFWRAKQLTTDHKPESAEERSRIMNSGGKVVVKSGVPRVVWNRPRNACHRGPIRKKTLIDEIPFLAVARSLGDLWSYNPERNEFVVSPDPDVRVIPINPNTFRCLIFGTDGLWNVVSAQEAVDTVREKEVINERLLAQKGDSPNEANQWTNPSKSLVEEALRTWSHKKMRADNTSVVTVILYPPGQVDHNMDNNTSRDESNFAQHISYGLEYTELQGDVPRHDDTITYKEMALKYLPPEPYRNFNYYADESDTDSDDNDNEESEDEPELILIEKRTGHIQQNPIYSHHYTTSNISNWQHNSVNTLAKMSDEKEDDDDDDDETGKRDTRPKHSSNERQVCVIDYQNYGHIEAEETNNATDSYINTFAESYNSILTASQDDCIITAAGCSPSSSLSNNSNSNSNSNCQSVTPPNMNAILQEQHQYQQQCMSEEDGYSLTKLETRREQQTCKGNNRNANLSNDTTSSVQTFKIFHESTQDSQQIGANHTNSERFYHQQPQQQQQFMSHILPKPLELHSLLQQEREEEQQVAYERLQMENKLHQHQQNIASYICLQPSVSNLALQSNEQPSVDVEYLEEESHSVINRELIAANNLCFQQDESIQIHEVSSSIEESLSKIKCGQVNARQIEIIEKIEILPNFNFEACKTDAPAEDKRQDLNNSSYSSISASERNICLPPPQSAATISKLSKSTHKLSLNQSKRTKTKYLYNNVTNENLQRISKTKYNPKKYSPSESSGNSRRNICLTSSGSMTTTASTSTSSFQRQLRSTSSPCANTAIATPVIDYGKRTLRTRNSLSKDIKAKSSLVQATLKYSQNAVTRNFLRTNAANLMVAKPLHINDLNATSCSIRSLSKANNMPCTPNRNAIKTRREKCDVALNASLNQCKTREKNSTHSQLNLRSRQTTTPSSAAPSLTTNVNTLRNPSATTTPVIKRASLNERRILRSMHTRSTSSKGYQTPANFSKTTRTQSSGSNLAAPPPSPKLINAVAAVAAATRARTLLNANKHVAAANGTQSVVSAVFGKRTTLRSNVSTHSTALSDTNTSSISTPSTVHQTLRGRIVKKLKR